MSQALFSETISPPHLHSTFMPLSSLSPPKKLHFCFLLLVSWLGTGGRQEFGMRHRFLELVSVIVFDCWRFNIECYKKKQKKNGTEKEEKNCISSTGL